MTLATRDQLATIAYRGTGFPCRRSRTCTFRVTPSSGDANHLRSAAQLRNAHERRCPFESRRDPRSDRPMPSIGSSNYIDELASARADVDVDADLVDVTIATHDDPPPRMIRELRSLEVKEGMARVAAGAAPRRETSVPTGEGRFVVTCRVCGDRFRASGGRAQFCSKVECQAARPRA